MKQHVMLSHEFDQFNFVHSLFERRSERKLNESWSGGPSGPVVVGTAQNGWLAGGGAPNLTSLDGSDEFN